MRSAAPIRCAPKGRDRCRAGCRSPACVRLRVRLRLILYGVGSLCQLFPAWRCALPPCPSSRSAFRIPGRSALPSFPLVPIRFGAGQSECGRSGRESMSGLQPIRSDAGYPAIRPLRAADGPERRFSRPSGVWGRDPGDTARIYMKNVLPGLEYFRTFACRFSGQKTKITNIMHSV